MFKSYWTFLILEIASIMILLVLLYGVGRGEKERDASTRYFLISIVFAISTTLLSIPIVIPNEILELSNGEIMANLWEDDSHESYLRGLKKDLNDVLKDIGKDGIIIQQRGKIGVYTDMIKCDYYEYLNGDVHALNLYRGEYMSQYS